MLFHSELLTAYFLHPLHFRLKHKSGVSLGVTKTSIYIITELNPDISPKLNMNLARNYPLDTGSFVFNIKYYNSYSCKGGHLTLRVVESLDLNLTQFT